MPRDLRGRRFRGHDRAPRGTHVGEPANTVPRSAEASGFRQKESQRSRLDFRPGDARPPLTCAARRRATTRDAGTCQVRGSLGGDGGVDLNGEARGTVDRNGVMTRRPRWCVHGRDRAGDGRADRMRRQITAAWHQRGATGRWKLRRAASHRAAARAGAAGPPRPRFSRSRVGHRFPPSRCQSNRG